MHDLIDILRVVTWPLASIVIAGMLRPLILGLATHYLKR